MSFVHSIHVLCPGGIFSQFCQIFKISKKTSSHAVKYPSSTIDCQSLLTPISQCITFTEISTFTIPTHSNTSFYKIHQIFHIHNHFSLRYLLAKNSSKNNVPNPFPSNTSLHNIDSRFNIHNLFLLQYLHEQHSLRELTFTYLIYSPFIEKKEKTKCKIITSFHTNKITRSFISCKIIYLR